MTPENEVYAFINTHVMQPILDSPAASPSLKQGVRLTQTRLKQRDAHGMVHYFWSAIIGTPNSISFASRMRAEGFTRFEDVLEEFRIRFDNDWLRKSKTTP